MARGIVVSLPAEAGLLVPSAPPEPGFRLTENYDSRIVEDVGGGRRQLE